MPRPKYLCKICDTPVTEKTGQRCEGVCRKWVHFDCLDFSPEKIVAIREGIIKINCVCPNCEDNKQDKSGNRKTGRPIPGCCGKSNCPAAKAIISPSLDGTLKSTDADTTVSKSSLPKAQDTKVSVNSLHSESVHSHHSKSVHSVHSKSDHSLHSQSVPSLHSKSDHSGSRLHQTTSPIRGHQSTCISAHNLPAGFQQTELLNPQVNTSTSALQFHCGTGAVKNTCSDSCTSMCSNSSKLKERYKEHKCTAKQVNPEASKHVRCPYCYTRLVLGGIPRKLLQLLEEQPHRNSVIECKDTLDNDVSPCFEYSSSKKNADKPSLTQRVIDECIERAKKNKNQFDLCVSSVHSMVTVDNPEKLPKESKQDDVVPENPDKRSVLGLILGQLYDNVEDMRDQIKELVQYFICPNCGVKK